MAQHLGEIEGVPGRLGVQDTGELVALGVEVVAGPGLQVGGHAGPVEATEVHPVDVGLAEKVGDGVGQGRGDVKGGVPVVDHQQQAAGLTGADDMGQHGQRRGRGPVDVLQDQDRRRLLGHGGQPGGHRVEEPVPLGLRVGGQRWRQLGEPGAQLGSEADELPGEPTQRRRRRLAQ